MQKNINFLQPTPCFPIVDETYLQEVAASFAPACPTPVFATYWYFAAERQAMFFRRVVSKPAPWSEDQILALYKFTNVYRASDRVSQYLIRHVIYSGVYSVQDVFFRIILFKLFNKIQTWELLERQVGEVCYSSYSFDVYDRVLSEALERGERIFSAAYIMPSGVTAFGHKRKHRNCLLLLERMLSDQVPTQIVASHNLYEVFRTLRTYPMLGDFLAYQYAIDINYSPLVNHSESDFVVPGPGARNGIQKCFSNLGGLTEDKIIRLMAERQEDEFARLGFVFQSLWGRPLQLIDCQNLFCEVDKYARVAHPTIRSVSGRQKIKQRYRAQSNLIQYWFPPKWELNDFVLQDTAQSGP